MDKVKLEVLNEKKKEILKQIVNLEFNKKLSKSVFVLNDKTLQMLEDQLSVINKMIDNENTTLEK